MGNLTIEARDGRLSVLGYQPEVKRIYWSALPSKLPTYGQTLDLDGCEITAIYTDGSEAVVTDFCTFSPASGTAVPNAHTLTVTATYTARSGAVCQADEVLPICSLDHIKIIIPDSVPEFIKERCIAYYDTPTASDFAREFGFADVWVAAYWAQGGDIVRVTKLDTDSVLTSPCFTDGTYLTYTPCIEFRVSSTSSATFDRYTTPTDHASVTYSHAFRLNASFTLYGQTFTDTAYLSADICLSYEMKNPPLEYSGTETITINARDPDVWKLVYSETGDQPLSLLYPYLGVDVITSPAGTMFRIPSGQTYIERVPDPRLTNVYCFELIVTLEDSASGWFAKIKDGEPAVYITNPNMRIEFSCADGAVSWTFTPQ